VPGTKAKQEQTKVQHSRNNYNSTAEITKTEQQEQIHRTAEVIHQNSINGATRQQNKTTRHQEKSNFNLHRRFTQPTNQTNNCHPFFLVTYCFVSSSFMLDQRCVRA
jgi:hypothetical protein